MILIGGIIGFFIIIISFKSIKNKIAKKDMICTIKIVFKEKEVTLKAIIDTGNFLKDPLTKSPVVIVEKTMLEGMISENILNNLQDIINGKKEVENEYMSKIRLIPFSALGTENGLLLGIKPDNFIVYYQEKLYINKNIVVGVYDKKLSKSNKYNALIGLEILEK